jgi:hypothetical protein
MLPFLLGGRNSSNWTRSLGTDSGGAYVLRSISNLSLRRFAKPAVNDAEA